jgi:hypothetical protein
VRDILSLFRGKLVRSDVKASIDLPGVAINNCAFESLSKFDRGYTFTHTSGSENDDEILRKQFLSKEIEAEGS